MYEAVSWYVTTPQFATYGWVLVAVLLGVLLYRIRSVPTGNGKPGFFTRLWGRHMDRKERRRYVNTYTADKLTDVLEDAVANDDLSRREVDKIYRQLYKVTGNKDFMQKRARPADVLEVNQQMPLKERILHRMGFGWVYKPVTMPDPTLNKEEVPAFKRRRA